MDGRGGDAWGEGKVLGLLGLRRAVDADVDRADDGSGTTHGTGSARYYEACGERATPPSRARASRDESRARAALTRAMRDPKVVRCPHIPGAEPTVLIARSSQLLCGACEARLDARRRVASSSAAPPADPSIAPPPVKPLSTPSAARYHPIAATARPTRPDAPSPPHMDTVDLLRDDWGVDEPWDAHFVTPARPRPAPSRAPPVDILRGEGTGADARADAAEYPPHAPAAFSEETERLFRERRLRLARRVEEHLALARRVDAVRTSRR